MLVYQFLNIFFFVFHTVLILFNTFGWMFRRARKWNLLTLLLTAGSWFVLGIWFGWGYCVCTDWHWAVRERLGYNNESRSYIHFLLVHLTGINFSTRLVELGTVVVFFGSFALSCWFNVDDYRRKK